MLCHIRYSIYIHSTIKYKHLQNGISLSNLVLLAQTNKILNSIWFMNNFIAAFSLTFILMLMRLVLSCVWLNSNQMIFYLINWSLWMVKWLCMNTYIPLIYNSIPLWINFLLLYIYEWYWIGRRWEHNWSKIHHNL